ncbi:hypothetical protein HDU67_008346, partial [Dinochytrium kinnereticum]
MAVIRDAGPSGRTPPTSHHFEIASPFSRTICYLDQLRFVAGTAVVGDRIRHRETCSQEVLDAVVEDERVWPPLPRGGFYAETFLEGGVRICDDEELFDDGGDNRTSTPCRPNIEWVVYATSCSKGLNRLAKNLADSRIPLTILGMGRGWRGWGQRIRAYHDYTVALTEHLPFSSRQQLLSSSYTSHTRDELVKKARSRLLVFSDGDDVILSPSCDAEEVARRFVERPVPTSPLLFAAEKACWPRTERSEMYEKDMTTPELLGGIETPERLVDLPSHVRDPRRYARPLVEAIRTATPAHSSPSSHGSTAFANTPTKSTSFRYLNAGTFMGRAMDTRSMLRNTYVDECYDDQGRFTEGYLGGWGKTWNDSEMVNEVEEAMTLVGRLKAEVERGVLGWRDGADEDTLPPIWVREVVADLEKAKGRLRNAVMKLERADISSPSLSGKGTRRPLVSLDHENHVMAALYDVFAEDLFFDDDAAPPNSSVAPPTFSFTSVIPRPIRLLETNPTLHRLLPLHTLLENEKVTPGDALRVKEWYHRIEGVVQEPKGVCVFHQNGRKKENRVLEWLVREIGMGRG